MYDHQGLCFGIGGIMTECIIIPLWIIIYIVIIWVMSSILFFYFYPLPKCEKDFTLSEMIFTMLATVGILTGGAFIAGGLLWLIIELSKLLPCIKVI